MDIVTKSLLLSELVVNQLSNVPENNKLGYNDMKRLAKYLPNSIFEDKCCLWTGTNNKYINFYLNGRKISLHRLLYINYSDSLSDDEYLKFSCNNINTCCCIRHLIKIKYKNSIKVNDNKTTNNKKLDIDINDSDLFTINI